MKYIEVTFSITPCSETATDILSAMLADVGFETFQPSENGLMAWVQETFFSQDSLKDIIDSFPMDGIDITFLSREAEDEDWNSQWEQEGFKPIFIASDCGDEYLVAVHDVHHHDIPNSLYDIVIHPRQAFGTGSHQTTRMILHQLSQLDLEDKDVVDAGTGTGILSIMCAKRGAKNIFAYDIDEWSVENTRDNLLLNNVDNVSVALGDSSVLTNIGESFPALPRQYDLLIANINRNILLGDMPRFASVIKNGGRLLLSGFYAQDVPVLLESTSALGFHLLEEVHDEEWTMLLLQKD